MEEAAADELIASPRHPYTKALLAAVPVLGEKKKQLQTIPGIVPSPCDFPPGCRFCDRCSAAVPDPCREQVPPLTGTDGHLTACHLITAGKEAADGTD